MTFSHTPAQARGRHATDGGPDPDPGRGQREMQFTPDIARAVLAIVGILPGMTRESVMADIQGVIDAQLAADPDLKATARPYPGAMFVDGTLEQDDGREPDLALSRPIVGCSAKRRRSTARTPSTTPSAFPNAATPPSRSVPARTAGRRSTNTSISTRPWRRRKFSRSRFSTWSVPLHDIASRFHRLKETTHEPPVPATCACRRPRPRDVQCASAQD